MTRRHSFINLELTTYTSPLVRASGFQNQRNFVCGIRNQGKFWLWNPESWALESGIQLKESGILLTIVIQNPRSTCSTDMTKTGIQYLESRIQGVESRIQDCHGSPYNGRYSSFAFPFVWFKLVSTNTPFYSLCSVWSLFCLRSLISLSFSLLPFLVLSLLSTDFLYLYTQSFYFNLFYSLFLACMRFTTFMYRLQSCSLIQINRTVFAIQHYLGYFYNYQSNFVRVN